MRHRADLLQSRRPRRFLLLTCSILSFSTVCAAASGAIRSGNSVDSTPTLVIQAQPSLRILPIHQAKFLAGARFDFRIEANHVSARPTVWEVTVAGKPLEAFFGTPGTITNTAETSQEQTLRDVAFTEPGTYTVSAKVVAGETMLTKTVTYAVVTARPTARQAKNVILFIGDGMSLPIRTAARIVSRGLTEGKYNAMLEMDDMEAYAAVTTSGMESIATDSANSASAYATGHKSVVNAMGVYPDNTPDPTDDPRVETIVELVKRTRHMAVGPLDVGTKTDAATGFVSLVRIEADQVAVLH